MYPFATSQCFLPKLELVKETAVGVQVLAVVHLLLALSKSHGSLQRLKLKCPNCRKPFSTGRHLRKLTAGSIFGRLLWLGKPKGGGMVMMRRFEVRDFFS